MQVEDWEIGGQVQTTEKPFKNFGHLWEQRKKARLGRGNVVKEAFLAWEELDHADEIGPMEREMSMV